MTEEVYALRIPIYGDPTASASDKSYRIATGAIDDDPDGLYLSGALTAYPKEIQHEVAVLDSLVEGGEQKFMVGGSDALVDQLAAALCRYDDAGVIAYLAADIGPSDTTITLTESGLDGTKAFLGLECMVLGTETGPGTKTYSGCTRGALRTVARAHRVDGDHEVYDQISVLKGRIIELIKVPKRGGYGDEVVRWTGIINRRPETGIDSIEAQARLLTSVIEDAQIMGRGRWRGEVDAGAVARVGSATGTAQSGQQSQPTKPMAGTGSSSSSRQFLLCIDGKYVVKAFWTDADTVVWGADVLFGEPPIANPDGLEDFDAIAPGTPCWEIVTSDADVQPILRGAISNGYLSQNPARLLQQLLTSTPGGGNGSWDLGIGLLGIPVHVEALDTDSFDRAAARWADVRVDRLGLGVDGEAVRFGDIAEKILRPLHASWTITASGLGILTYRDAIPYEGADVTLTADNHLDYPSKLDMNDEAGLDRAQVTTGTYLGGREREARVNDLRRTERYPFHPGGEITVDASAYGPKNLVWSSAQAALAISEAYKFPPPIFSALVEDDVYPGDLVDYTHPHIRDHDGSRGMERRPCMAIGRKVLTGDDELHEAVEATLAVTGAGLRRVGAIANSAKITSFTFGGGASGEHIIVVDRDAWKLSGSTPLFPDSSPFAAGMRVNLVDYDLARKGATYEDVEIFEVQTSTPDADHDTLLLDPTKLGTGSLLTVGDVVRHASEGAAGAPLSSFAWMAPTSGDFASTREPYQAVLDITPRLGSTARSGWERIDDDGATDEWIIDEALLMKVAQNVEWLVSNRLGVSTVTFDDAKPLLLHGNPLAMMPIFSWHKPPHLTTIVLELLCEGSVADVEVTAVVLTAAGQPVSSATVTVGSAFSGTKQLTLTGLGRFEGMLYIALPSTSDEDAALKLNLKGADITAMTTRYLTGPVALSWVNGRVYKAKPIDSGSSYASARALPGERLVMGDSTAGSNHFVHVWPYWPQAQVDAFNDLGPIEFDFIPVGVATVHCLEIKESVTTLAAPAIEHYRAGLETAARTFRALQGAMEWMARNQTPIQGGAGVLNTSREAGAAAVPSGAILQAQDTVTGEGLCAAAWWVGRYQEAEDAAGNSTYLSRIVVEGLLGVYADQSAPDDVLAEVYLVLSDRDGSGTLITGTSAQISVPVLKADLQSENAQASKPLSALGDLRLYRNAAVALTADGISNTPALSLWPATTVNGGDFNVGWAGLGLRPFKVVIVDTVTNGVTRWLRLMATIAGVSSGEGVIAGEGVVCVPTAQARIERLPLA